MLYFVETKVFTLVSEKCRAEGIPVNKGDIKMAVMRVSSVLKLASGGKAVKSENKMKMSKVTKSSESRQSELLNYKEGRKEDCVLIGTTFCDPRDYLNRSCLVVSSDDLNKKDFALGLGLALLEKEGYIYIETKRLTKPGLDRLLNLLVESVSLWDSRLTILLENHRGFPITLSAHVETNFVNKNHTVYSPPQKRAKTTAVNKLPTKTDHPVPDAVHVESSELDCFAKKVKDQEDLLNLKENELRFSRVILLNYTDVTLQ